MADFLNIPIDHFILYPERATDNHGTFICAGMTVTGEPCELQILDGSLPTIYKSDDLKEDVFTGRRLSVEELASLLAKYQTPNRIFIQTLEIALKKVAELNRKRAEAARHIDKPLLGLKALSKSAGIYRDGGSLYCALSGNKGEHFELVFPIKHDDLNSIQPCEPDSYNQPKLYLHSFAEENFIRNLSWNEVSNLLVGSRGNGHFDLMVRIALHEARRD